jgi:hypothetical protein
MQCHILVLAGWAQHGAWRLQKKSWRGWAQNNQSHHTLTGDLKDNTEMLVLKADLTQKKRDLLFLMLLNVSCVLQHVCQPAFS